MYPKAKCLILEGRRGSHRGLPGGVVPRICPERQDRIKWTEHGASAVNLRNSAHKARQTSDGCRAMLYAVTQISA